MEPDNYERAYVAVQKALQLSNNDIFVKEKVLINALSKRDLKKPKKYNINLQNSGAFGIEKVPDKKNSQY